MSISILFYLSLLTCLGGETSFVWEFEKLRVVNLVAAYAGNIHVRKAFLFAICADVPKLCPKLPMFDEREKTTRR